VNNIDYSGIISKAELFNSGVIKILFKSENEIGSKEHKDAT
jgi:hypothetical protein